MILRSELAQTIGDCLNALGRFWMFTPTVQAADDMELVADDLLESGPVQYWAAGLVFAIARHNDLTTRKIAIAISLQDVANYFEIAPELVLDHADRVHEELELDKHSNLYTEFDFPQLDTDFDEDEESLYEEGRMLAIFRQKDSLDYNSRFELEDRIWEELHFFNEDEEEENHVLLNSINWSGNTVEIELEGFLEDIDLFCYELEEHDLDLLELRSLDEYTGNRYKPSSHYAIFMEQYEAMGLDHLRFDNLADLEDLMQNFVGKNAEEISEERNIPPQSRALIDAIRAFELPKDQSIEISQAILERFPRCVEAHICIAGWEMDRIKRLQLLNQAMEEGAKDLNIPEIEAQRVWWLDHRTRPYMRAMRFIAEEYIAENKLEDGLPILWKMLTMDETDHLSNRLLLFELSVIDGDWPSVEKLLARYPNEDSLLFVYGKVIYLYHTIGVQKRTKNALLKAYNRNRFPLRLVAGLEEYPEDGLFFTPGDKLEATTIIDFLLACFSDDQKLAEFFIQELYEFGAWEKEYPNFGLAENEFVPSAKIIPLDRQSDN